MTDQPGAKELVTTKLETSLVFDENGRIVRQNDPEHSTGPRLLIYGFDSGNILRLRNDVSPELADQVSELFEPEPPLNGRHSHPVHEERYIELLTAEAPVERSTAGVMFKFPAAFNYRNDVRLICSGAAEGDKLENRLRSEGLSEELIDLDFRNVEDFWKPWCVAMHDDRIASVGFTARLGQRGAESGIVTVPSLRGRGFAAAAVAGWDEHIELRGKTIYYSTSQDNLSSQRVAERLDLEFIGASYVIF